MGIIWGPLRHADVDDNGDFDAAASRRISIYSAVILIVSICDTIPDLKI